MDKTIQNHLSSLNHEYIDDHIRSFSKRTGELAGQLLTELLSGILVFLLVERSPSSGRSPMVMYGSDSIGRASIITHGPEKLLKGKEVAEFLNISKAKAYRLMSTGEIPCLRYDKTVRVRKKDLDNFINTHIVYTS